MSVILTDLTGVPNVSKIGLHALGSATRLLIFVSSFFRDVACAGTIIKVNVVLIDLCLFFILLAFESLVRLGHRVVDSVDFLAASEFFVRRDHLINLWLLVYYKLRHRLIYLCLCNLLFRFTFGDRVIARGDGCFLRRDSKIMWTIRSVLTATSCLPPCVFHFDVLNDIFREIFHVKLYIFNHRLIEFVLFARRLPSAMAVLL